MKNFFKSIAFLLILILTVGKMYSVLAWKDTTGGYLSSVQQLRNTPENTIDVVFSGSSHCYCSIYPEYLWEEYGYSAFDMAVSGQDKVSNYYCLLEMLKTQSPQVIFVEMYALLYEGYSQEGNAYRNMLSMKDSLHRVKMIQEIVDKEQQTDYLLRWPIIHTRYTELTRYDFEQYAPSIYGRGAGWTWSQGSGAEPTPALLCGRSTALSEENRQWLDRLLRLKEEKNIDIVFFVAPMQVTDESQAVFNGAAEYVTAAGANWIDCNKLFEEIGLSTDTDFDDSMHCNAYGAKKITAYMGKYLQQYYDLEDHRGGENYKVWDQSLQLYRHCEAAQYLEQMDMESYLQSVADLEGMKIIVALEGDYKNSSLPMEQYAAWLGISPEQYETGGKWVFCDRERKAFLDNMSLETIYIELGEWDILKLENVSLKTGQSVLDNISINGTFYGKALNGLTIIVYDPLREMIISAKGFA